MRRSTVIGIVVLAAGALGVGAVAVGLVHARPAPSRTDGAGAAGSEIAGQQLSWAVSLDTELRQPGGAAGSHSGATTLTGEWVVTVSDASEAGYDLACELRHAHVSGRGFGDVDAADIQQLERKLGGRFWVSHQADGAATELHFPREMGDDVRNFLELLVTEAQLVRPVRPVRPVPQWSATERDGGGSYLAVYQQLRAQEIVKRKIRYLSNDGAGAARTASINVQILAAETHFTLDPRGFVNQLVGHEEVRLDAKMGAPALGVEVRLRMDHLQSGSAPELVGSLNRARSGLESGPVVTQRASDETLRARRDARLIKTLTLPGILAAVSGGSTDSATRAELEAFLRQHPADVPSAVAAARQADREKARIVLQAMGAAGNPAAQEALCGLAGDPGAAASLRVDAIGALVQTRRLAASTIAHMIRWMDAPEPTVRRQALFIAGAAGSNSHDVDPETTSRIETELLERYAKCRDTGCLDLLVALGNLATPKVVPSIERALRDPKAKVRAGAAGALRKVKDPSADRLISATMTDGDPSVRAAAVLAATFRPMGPLVEPLARLVRDDPVDYVRTDAIQALANHIDESPLIERTLLAAATGDSSPGVRRLARKALGTRIATAEPAGR